MPADLRDVVAQALADAAEKRFRRATDGAKVVGGTTANQTAWLEYADAVLAALSAAGLLRAEMAGEQVYDDVIVEAARIHYEKVSGIAFSSLPWIAARRLCDRMSAAAEIITADAERRVRAAVLEEAATALDGDLHLQNSEMRGYSKASAARIRALAAIPPDRVQPTDRQDQVIADYFGVTVEEVRRVRDAAPTEGEE